MPNGSAKSRNPYSIVQAIFYGEKLEDRVKRLLTRFLHAIEPDQLDSLRGIFSDASEDLIKQLPKMPQGTCILTGAYETIRHASVIQVRQRSTTHGGKTPDIWSDFEAAGWVGKRPIQQEDTHE